MLSAGKIILAHVTQYGGLGGASAFIPRNSYLIQGQDAAAGSAVIVVTVRAGVFPFTVRCKTIDRFSRKQDKILGAESVRRSTSKLMHDEHRSPPNPCLYAHGSAGCLSYTSGSYPGGVREGTASGKCGKHFTPHELNASL